MSRSLIRSIQLHPEVSGLVYQYGTGFFITHSSGEDILEQAYLYTDNKTGLLYDFLIPKLESGVHTLNSLSGFVNLTGAGNITVYTQGQNIFISGSDVSGAEGGGGSSGIDINTLNFYLATGNYNLNSTVRTTGTQTVNGAKTFSQSGNLIGNWTTSATSTFPNTVVNYSRLLDVSGIITGRVYNLNIGVYTLNGLSGIVTLSGAGNNVVSINGQNIIVSGISGSSLDISSLLSYLATGDYNLNSTVRTTGQQYIFGNKTFMSSGYLSGEWATNAAGTTSETIVNYGRLLNSSDSLYSNILSFLSTGDTYLNNVVRTTGQQYIFGNKTFMSSGYLSGEWATNAAGTTSETIVNYGRLLDVSGVLTGLIISSQQGVTSINGTSGALSIVGAGGTVVNTVGQTITIFSTPEKIFTTGLEIGSNYYSIAWSGTAFSAIPNVQVTVEVTGTNIWNVNVQNVTTTGFWALMSDVVNENGVKLHVRAIY